MSDIKGSVSGEGSPKKVWNSLEVSKLAIGALTPLVVAGLGVFLTLGAESRSDDRTIAAENRSKTREIAAEKRAEWREVRAKARDEKFALAAEDREARRAAAALAVSHALTRQMAELAAAREQLLRDQEAARQDEIRARAERRDDEVRARAADTERLNRRIERRSRIWDDLGPQLNDIHVFISRRGRFKELSAEQILQTKRSADQTFYNYKPFFSPEFVSAYDTFMAAAFRTCSGEGLDARIRATGLGRKDASDPRYEIALGPTPPRDSMGIIDNRMFAEQQAAYLLSLAYEDLMDAAAVDLGLGNATPDTPAPKRRFPVRQAAELENQNRGPCWDRRGQREGS